MLVGDEAEELVLDDGTAERAARRSSGATAGFFWLSGMFSVLLEEERSGVDPVCAAMTVERAVKLIGAGVVLSRDVRAGCRTLLRVVHGGVDADFCNCLRRRRGDGVADGEIDGRDRLNDTAGAEAGGDAGAVDDARGGDLAGALAVEEVAGVDAVEREAVGGVALAVGPDGLHCRGRSWRRCRREVRALTPGDRMATPVKLPVGSGIDSICCLVEHVAVGGVDGIQQRIHVDRDGFVDRADSKLGGKRDGAIRLNEDSREALRREAIVPKGQRVRADRQVVQRVGTLRIRARVAREPGVLGDGVDLDVGEGAAGRIGDRACDSAEGLLCMR